MNSKEIKETIDRLDDSDWQRMKEHMDKKFPNMKLPDMESFQDLVKLYEIFQRHKELRATSSKRQATSSPQSGGIHKTRKDIYENK